MLQKFDPNRFTLRQDRPNGTQAHEDLAPQVPLGHIAALLASDPILREQVLQSLEAKKQPSPDAQRTRQPGLAPKEPRTPR